MVIDKNITMEDILNILPHRSPFLFVDRVVKIIPDKMILCERELRPDEPQFIGHFPSKPIMPGVLVSDALAQTSGLLFGLSKHMGASGSNDTPELFFLAAVNMKFTHPARPGDTLQMISYIDKAFGTLINYKVEANAGRNCIAKGNLTLAMKGGEG